MKYEIYQNHAKDFKTKLTFIGAMVFVIIYSTIYRISLNDLVCRLITPPFPNKQTKIK